jgi:hypothetical protein
MSAQLKSIIKKAKALTPLEQMELITAIYQLLQDTYEPFLLDSNFWQPKTLEQLYKDQQVKTIQNVADFAAEFWPEEEFVDEFNEYIYDRRQEDRLRD